MRKFLVLALVLMASAGFARESSIYVGTGAEVPDVWDGSPGDAYIADAFEVDGAARCDGDVVLGDDPADTITITGSMALTSPVSFPVGTALLPGIYFTGDPNTGYWWSAADVLNISCGGIEQVEIDAAAMTIVPDTDITGALDVDGDTDLDALTVSEQIDIAVGAVGAPSVVFTGSLTTGLYEVAADSPGISVAGANVGTWDAAGYQGDLGQTTPAAGDFTTLTTTGLTDLFAGAVGAPSVSFTGSATSGLYEIAGDNIGMAIGGALVGDFDATGLNNCPLGQTTAAAADVDTLTTEGVTDLFVGAVGAPSVTFTGSATTGLYEVAADSPGISVAGANVTTWDATGIAATGINGPIGTVTPAAGTFTNVDVGGTFNFGQDPADLVSGYKEIGDTVTFFDGFDYSDADLATHWDLTNTVGAGTNTCSVRPGWNEVVTAGAGGDTEGTQSNYLTQEREYCPRIETVVDLTAVAAGQTFSFGFYAAANEYVLIMHEPASNANWILRSDDTAGAETIDSGVAAGAGTPTKLAITIAADGTTTWAVDDVEMTVVGLTNQMTANPYYAYTNLINVAAAAHTAAWDYILIEQLKQQ